jgi:hypothetical protein
MALDERLKEWRKGYFYFLKTRVRPLGLLESIIDCVRDFLLALYSLSLGIVEFITMPLWFFPLTYWLYKKIYKNLKEAYKENGIELNDSYQPEEDNDNG